MLLAACATGGVVHVPATENSASGGQVRVVNERGAVSPQAARRIEQEGPTDLLAHHLREVEGVIESPLVLGNDAHLLIDGPQTYSAMFEAIEHAKSRVFVETYIIEAGKVGGDLAELLAKKRARGVEVRVLYDSVGSRPTPAEYFDRLRGAGIAVCEFNPINPLKLAGDADLGINNRDHRKVLVVDGRVAFTGGINISGVYSAGSFGSRRKAPTREEGWRDTHVMMRGPIVAQFEGLFANSWNGQACDDDVALPASARPGPAGDMAMRVVVADPASQRSELYVALLSAVEHAKERIWLTYGYFVPDHRVLDALQDAAKRGVDVRLVLPGFSDFWAPFHAGRSHYTALLRAGVRVFERRDALLHAKTAVIDSVWSSVGSTNLDWRSFVHNYEADLLVLDRDFAGEMEALFSMDEKASHEVKMVEWKNRGLKARVLEWFARRWEYLL
ncbi:MAG: phospholipase D-like domain-containing protein [Aromatoleum sp.]|uniref:phospholipase D-like domain-containing protein n=1 Tax=Aromatoleum sp. TaxID=2307007 RepID=UPI002895264C|nr:phospholipase D-like domain-containing protein [Aromatoleum sp.]MDT3671112.1 phospholipase D-like domain-containing protein [Aromatoleum sp.]